MSGALLGDAGAPVTRSPQATTVQAIVDALSVTLARPVLLDDPALVPIAYSPQTGAIDVVRSDSILARGARPAVHDALMRSGIAEARDAVEVPADHGLGMQARVCMPVRHGGELLGFVWLLDTEPALADAQLERARQAVTSIGRLLSRPKTTTGRDGGRLVAGLRSLVDAEREEAIAEALRLSLLPDTRVVLCLLATADAGHDLRTSADAVVRRLSVGHALAGAAPEGAAVVAATGDPVLRALPEDGLAEWICRTCSGDIAVAQSVPVPLDSLHLAGHQATVALRVARARPARKRFAAWSTLGADRLVAQLPQSSCGDVPQELQRLIHGEPELARTLEAFLESAGDVQATASLLSLHRSGVYYRLQRVEELTGLDLRRGDDRLLAHLAIRADRLS